MRHHVRDPAPLHVRLSTADPAQLPTQLPGHLHQHHVAQQSAAYLAVSLDGDLDSYDSDSGVDESLDAVHDFAYPADRHREPVDPRPAKRACPRVQQQLTAQSGFHVDYMPTDERKRLQILLARAMHANRCPFSLFDCELFREFFAGLRKVFILPPPDKIGGQLLVDCYAADMDIVRAELAMCTAGTITMDGATNVHGRSTMNVMVCTPQPYFVETATSGINRESSRYVAELIESAARRIRSWVRRDTDVTSMNGPLSFLAFCSDSCNQMRAARDLLVQSDDDDAIDFAYGCAPHAINNLAKDLCALTPVAAHVKQELMLVKYVRSKSLLRKIFDSQCLDVLGKLLAPRLFSPTRWSDVNTMNTRIIRLRNVFTLFPNAIRTARIRELVLDPAIAETITSEVFWDRCTALGRLLQPLAAVLAYLEADDTPLSAVYAAFVHIKITIIETEDAVWETLGLVPVVARDHLLGRLLMRFGRIYTPVFALALRCDPYFDSLRLKWQDVGGGAFFGLGQGDLLEQCQKALSVLCRRRDEAVGLAALAQFCKYTAVATTTQSVFRTLETMQPSHIWSMVVGPYSTLARILMSIYTCPTSAAAGERNHKACKAVLTKARAALGQEKVEMQSAIAYNQAQRVRAAAAVSNAQNMKRDSTVAQVIAGRISRDDQAVTSEPEQPGNILGELEEDGSLSVLLENVASFNAGDIPDILLFGPSDVN